MTTFAVVRSGGKQYLVNEGMELTVDLMDSEAGKKVELEALLKFDDDGKSFEVGKPVLKATVKAEVIDNVMGEKIRIARFKAKSRERKVRGFRSKLTKLKIVKIS